MRSSLSKFQGDGRSKRPDVERIRSTIRKLVAERDVDGLNRYLAALLQQGYAPEQIEEVQKMMRLLLEGDRQ